MINHCFQIIRRFIGLFGSLKVRSTSLPNITGVQTLFKVETQGFRALDRKQRADFCRDPQPNNDVKFPPIDRAFALCSQNLLLTPHTTLDDAYNLDLISRIPFRCEDLSLIGLATNFLPLFSMSVPMIIVIPCT
jgi:hypothetical protein